VYDFSGAGAEYIQSINGADFTDIALALFHYQYNHNSLYRNFADAIGRPPARVARLKDLPFLPASFFRTHAVTSGNWTAPPALTFESSGTTGETPSRHLVHEPALYEAALIRSFEEVYGDPAQYAILALLPSYLERSNASLVHMARLLTGRSGHPDCGFYLNEWATLAGTLQRLKREGQPVILLGVTFALLDFAAAYPIDLRHTIVIETGGMKGRREEWTRDQVHQELMHQWNLEAVHSEYGMTELLSQAYAVAAGRFAPASTMRLLIRDLHDPLSIASNGTGCANIIDLANVHSCAFIATDDIARLEEPGNFSILGRADHTALRGCSLMTA
jgi:hypothetical protein